MKKFLRASAFAIFFLLLIGGEASAQQTGTQQLTLTVQAATLTISTATLPYGITTVAYSQSVAATGGVAPYTFSISAGTLPAGFGDQFLDRRDHGNAYGRGVKQLHGQSDGFAGYAGDGDTGV